MILLLALLVPQEGPEPWKVVWFPDDVLYRHPLADPRAPYAGSRLQFPIRKEDDLKIETALAGLRSLLRLEGVGESFEVEAEAAAYGRFDINESWDMDGVDYRFGFPFVYRRGPLAMKLHPWHVTSHLGDEYEEREGALRIKYARNELALGISWEVTEAWRVYGEAGWGFIVGDPNDPWRWMAGVEFVDRLLGPDLPEVYLAANATSYKEIDWEAMLNVQAGLWIRPNGTPRGFRFGLEYFRGRSPLTQFFRERDHYWSAGFWVHF